MGVEERKRLCFVGVAARLASSAWQKRSGQAYNHVEDLRFLTTQPLGDLPGGCPCLLGELTDIALATEGRDLLEEVRRRALAPCVEDDVAMVASLRASGRMPKMGCKPNGDYLCREYLEADQSKR